MGSNVFVWTRVLDTECDVCFPPRSFPEHKETPQGRHPRLALCSQANQPPSLVIPTLHIKSGEEAVKVAPPFVENSRCRMCLEQRSSRAKGGEIRLWVAV